MTTDERTVAAFELSDLGVDHAQYFQGAGVAFTDWDEVFVGVGDTAQEAAEDAIQQACFTGWNIARELESDMDDALLGFNAERSAHAECFEHAPDCDLDDYCPEPHNDSEDCASGPDCPVVTFAECDCHDECELHHYAALYVRYA